LRSPQTGDRGRERSLQGTDPVGGEEEDRPGERVRRVRDEHGDKIFTDLIGMDPNPPGAAEMREHHWVLRRLAEAEHARPRLLQILLPRQFRQYGPLEREHESLRRMDLREQAREETQDREQGDRENRRRGRRGGETGRASEQD
jgi:hypothetical protein